MKPAFDSVASYVTENSLPSNQTDSPVQVRTYVCTKNGHWAFTAIIDVAGKTIAFHSICPLQVPVDRQTKVAEFLALANRGTFGRGFLLDFECARVRYITQMQLPGESGRPEVEKEVKAAVRQMVKKNLAVMGRYLPGIIKIISSDATPAEAYAAVEPGMR